MYRKNLEEELSQCKSANLSAKLTFDTQEKKLQEQLILKDKQIISIANKVTTGYYWHNAEAMNMPSRGANPVAFLQNEMCMLNQKHSNDKSRLVCLGVFLGV